MGGKNTHPKSMAIVTIVDVFKDVLSTQTLAEDDSQFDMLFSM